MGEALLEADGLTKHFTVRRGVLGRSTVTVRAVDGVSFAIESRKTLGLVGESGCGKTTTSKLILNLEAPTGGTIRFEGRALDALDRRGRGHYRRSVQAVFQDPYASLDPRMRVGTIVAEPLVINERGVEPRRDSPRACASSWTWWACPRAPPASFPTSSRAASASASPSPGRWRSLRVSWCSTSPSPPSTCRSAPRS